MTVSASGSPLVLAHMWHALAVLCCVLQGLLHMLALGSRGSSCENLRPTLVM